MDYLFVTNRKVLDYQVVHVNNIIQNFNPIIRNFVVKIVFFFIVVIYFIEEILIIENLKKVVKLNL